MDIIVGNTDCDHPETNLMEFVNDQTVHQIVGIMVDG